MNHLAHFLLAYPDPHLMAGGFLGDFVKGPLTRKAQQNQLHPAVIQGIRLHRAIDRYSDQHPITRQSVSRLDPAFRRYGGIICDVVYDHFLCRHWDEFSDVPVSRFSQMACQSVLDHKAFIPANALHTIQRMDEHASLAQYHKVEFVVGACHRIGERLKRDNPMSRAPDEFQKHHDGLLQDFREFMPDAMRFAREWSTDLALHDK